MITLSASEYVCEREREKKEREAGRGREVQREILNVFRGGKQNKTVFSSSGLLVGGASTGETECTMVPLSCFKYIMPTIKYVQAQL